MTVCAATLPPSAPAFPMPKENVMLELPPDTEARLREQASRHGSDVNDYLREILSAAENDRFAFTEEAFAASAESTRHVWDTPEEDAAWAHLQ